MNQRFFNIARQISKKSPSKFKLGCAILNRRNTLISVGYNDMTKTHSKCPTWGNFIHAEIDALLGLSYKDTYKGSAYIYRETAEGSLGMAKPCPVCHAMLSRAGIKNIYFTTPSGFRKEQLKT